MMQQVNLFRSQFVSRPTAFGWRSLLWMVGIVLVTMAGISVLDVLQSQRLNRQVAQVAGQLQDLRDGLTRLNQRVRSVEADPHRAAARELLRQQNGEALRFFQALNSLSRRDPIQFSGYFRGLAKHPVNGLWLEEMQIDAEGQALVLRGRALDPSLIPRFLQGLRDDPSFAGHAFAEVEFERIDEIERDRTVRFQLRSIADTDGGGRDG